jgi:hypothetical protein
MTLGVDRWPAGGGPDRPTTTPAAPPPPVEEGAPAWWTGENTNEFLAAQGIILG